MHASQKMPDLESLRLFDSCVTLGRIVSLAYPDYLTPENLVEMMDRYSIAEALVHEHHARQIYPREQGNRRLLDAIREIPRLHPAWVIEPPKEPGKGAAKALVEEMLAAGVKAARLPMKVVPPLAWLWEDLATVLEEHRIPCFLDFGRVSTSGNLSDTDLNGVRDLALAHPELPLVLSDVVGGLGIHCGIVPLIRRTPNILIDITGLLDYWRQVAAEVGPERVLFSTGAPFTDPGIYISNVQYATEIDENAKRMICGDNLRCLLKEVR